MASKIKKEIIVVALQVLSDMQLTCLSARTVITKVCVYVCVFVCVCFLCVFVGTQTTHIRNRTTSRTRHENCRK